MTSINAMFENQFSSWPFKDGDKVELTENWNEKPKGLKGTVDLKKPAFFWVIWDDNTYSSFSKLQMKYLKPSN